uniref:Uncharacterized protein n=1 Tax=Oryza glumipatula TaxID=40148 RepID=A0A0D9Y2Q3_9ORYZ
MSVALGFTTREKSTMTSKISAGERRRLETVTGRERYVASEAMTAVGEPDVEVPRIAGVEDAEAVAAALDGLERPRLAVDGDDLAEVLRLPLRVDGWHGADGVHEDGAVDVELAVGDDEVEVVVAAGEVHGGLELGLLDDVGGEEAGEEADAGEAEGVVVVPEVARRLHVGVFRVHVLPFSAKSRVNQAKAWPSNSGGWAPPWRWTTVGTPPFLGMAVGTLGSHGRMWASGRWFCHSTASGTPCRATMVGPGNVAVCSDCPYTNTGVGGMSRWNCCMRKHPILKLFFDFATCLLIFFRSC